MMTFTEDQAFDQEQLKRFTALTDELTAGGVSIGRRHAVSSYTIFQHDNAWLDMVRTGMALYGVYPDPKFRPGAKIDLRPAVALRARVAYVKKIAAGTSAGYERAYMAKQDTWIATVPVGHTDGWPRVAAKGARVRINNRLYPVIASVSASHTIVELGAEQTAKIGDVATMFDWTDGSRPEDVATACGASVYDLLMHLNYVLPKVRDERGLRRQGQGRSKGKRQKEGRRQKAKGRRQKGEGDHAATGAGPRDGRNDPRNGFGADAAARACGLLSGRDRQRHRALPGWPHRRLRAHVHRREREPSPQRDLGRAGGRQRAAAAAHESRVQLQRPTVEPGRTPAGLLLTATRRHGRWPTGRVHVVPPHGQRRRRGLPDSRRGGHAGVQPRQQVDRVHEGRRSPRTRAAAPRSPRPSG